MSLRAALLIGVAGLLAGPALAPAQPAAVDPDVREGIRLVETGDYDAAILTLDNAARRLSADPARVRDLSQAYLYLGIAYLGKGHEAAARAKFREAVAKVKDLTLNPTDFPPKVIDLFEAAREETLKEPASAAAPTAAAAPAPAPVESGKKKGGSKTLLIVGGVGAAAAVGIAAAAGGGGGSSSTNPSVTPTPAPIRVDDLSGFLPFTEGSRHFAIRVLAAGPLTAELSWTAPEGLPVELIMQLFDGTHRDVAISNRTTPSAAVLHADVVAQEYDLSVFYAEECPGCEAQFHLLVSHP